MNFRTFQSDLQETFNDTEVCALPSKYRTWNVSRQREAGTNQVLVLISWERPGRDLVTAPNSSLEQMTLPYLKELSWSALTKRHPPNSFRGNMWPRLVHLLDDSDWPRHSHVTQARAIRALHWDFICGPWNQKLLSFLWKWAAVCGHLLPPKQFTCST